MHGSLHFRVTIITDLRTPLGCTICALCLAVNWQNSRKTTKVRHNNMTQIASLLAVATFLLGFCAHFTVREVVG